MITLERRDAVTLVTLDRGVTNAISLELLETLTGALERVAADESVRGVVLASASAKFFCIGFDIPGLFDLERERFGEFYRAFNRVCLQLLALPRPTVAAVAGHAVAGGCILTLACDYRVLAADRAKVGLNEVRLGVPIPCPADLMLRAIVGERAARDINEGGALMPAEACRARGLVDEVVPTSQVVDRAVEIAAKLGAHPAAGHRAIKRSRVSDIVRRAAERREEDEAAFLDCWFDPEARDRLRDAMARF